MPDEPALWGYALYWTDESGVASCTVHEVADHEEVELRAMEALEMLLLSGHSDALSFLLSERTDRGELLEQGAHHPAVIGTLEEGDPDEPIDPLDGYEVGVISLGADVPDAPMHMVVTGPTFIAVGLLPTEADRDTALEALRNGEPMPVLIAWEDGAEGGQGAAGIVRHPRWGSPDKVYQAPEEVNTLYPQAPRVSQVLGVLCCHRWESWRQQYGEPPPVEEFDATSEVAEA